MRRIQRFLGSALVLGSIGLFVAEQGEGQSAAYGATGDPTISKDDFDNEDGTDPSEGGGVVDPVPQDDGSDGVDDGSGDGS